MVRSGKEVKDIFVRQVAVVLDALSETKFADKQGEEIVDTLSDKFKLMEDGIFP